MIDSIADVINLLHPSVLNFIRSLNDSDLLKFREAADLYYESLGDDSTSDPLRSLRLYTQPTPSVVKSREERQVAGFKKLFAEYNNLANLTDKEFAEVAIDELWARQSIYSRESAMLEGITDRLARSDAGPLKPVNSDEFAEFVEAMKL